ncbi:MAG: hypothetical protein ACI94Y_000391 [Maribacter sp.]|jgi:hypothetical protein
MNKSKYPKSFSHIGITVPDINKAVEFYEEVMGWDVIMPPSKVQKESDTAIGQMCIDVLVMIGSISKLLICQLLMELRLSYFFSKWSKRSTSI